MCAYEPKEWSLGNTVPLPQRWQTNWAFDMPGMACWPPGHQWAHPTSLQLTPDDEGPRHWPCSRRLIDFLSKTTDSSSPDPFSCRWLTCRASASGTLWSKPSKITEDHMDQEAAESAGGASKSGFELGPCGS
jgi:hypothetical protein